MSTSTTEKQYTPADLLAMPDEKNYELVDGQLLERDMGNEASWIGAEISGRLRDFLKQHDLGWVLGADAGYRCFPDDPGCVRQPDVSYIRRGRLPNDRPARGYETIPPDLAVEVVSPNETYEKVEGKVEEFLKAGVRLVWVINPDTPTATVYRPDGSGNRLHENDNLDGEDVLPGFRCRIGELFPPPVEAGK